MIEKFSVLMSLYIKETPSNLRDCLVSIMEQTVKPSEIVIVKDGPITEELEGVLREFIDQEPHLYKIVPLEKNVGLGLALAEGIIHCSNEIVARMDTDDICRKDRFELQLKEFENDKTLDICGSHIEELEENPDKIVSKRTVPLTHDEIAKYQRKRDGFNHMSVMFKKSAVLKAGNYQSCLLMEDTYLWVNMLLSGARCKNIDDSLVYVRIGKDMFERRGGLSYYKKYKEGRKKVRRTGYISWWDYRLSLCVQFIVAIMPNKLRGWVFKNILHK